MTLELANRFVTFPMGIAEDVIVKVENYNFLADFVIVDFEADPRVPIILGRPFLRTARALMDLYEEKLTLRVKNEEVVFYTDKSTRNNLSDIQSVHCIHIIDFSRYKPISGSITFPSTFSPSSPLVETSDSLLEEFADKHALLYHFHREMRTIILILKLIILYGDSYNDTHSKNDKTKDSKTKSLINEANIVESNILPPQLLTIDSTFPEGSSEIATLLSFLFGNKDKVFNPGIFILGEIQIFNNKSKDKDFKMNILYEKLFEGSNFHPLSSYQELLFFLELTVIETLLSFSSENEDKVFNPGILTSKGVHSFTLGLSRRTYETFKIINVHPNILNECPMTIFPFFCFCPKDKGIQG
ncbi:reverse transcriptase domain-containing protein [Tanacetum coccineum]